MLKYLVAAAAFTAMCATPADAQTEPAALPPVETLTCDQMMAEMSMAGQQMNSQLDPNFATDAQAMQAESDRRMQEARNASVGAGVVCAVPGLGMACTAAMNAQMANQMAHADEDRARRDALVGAMQNSMVGIDQSRMAAIGERWESQNCQMPGAPPQ